MILRTFIAALTMTATMALLAPPADAQTRERTVRRTDGTYVSIRDEDGRRRTRVIIQRRSFLDAGTQVQPGERKFTDYALPPTGRSAVAPAIDNTAFTVDKQIMPGPFDLPSKNNPRQW
ncbi:MAG: hypothetical protein JOZ70_01665 [Pseudolabrys sp.]|nr:hypothetical protein [Pseudolabrys sp.]MBV9953932.1 hypothetical protein [Pseudolabrys sp.]